MARRRLTRREFLRLSATAAAGVVAASCAPQPTPEAAPEAPAVEEKKEEAPAAAPAEEIHEAPMLHELVQQGKLPPLEERIPAEPLVIEPFETIGKYGGTWHRYDTSSSGSHVAMAMYGYSLVHWVKDGLGKRGGLAKSWDYNEDKTEWTFYFRKGTKWSDGEPFTVDDILFWWEDMVLNPEHPDSPPDWAIAGGKTMELEKIDDYTLKFKFAAPAPLLADRLAMWPNGVIAEKVVVPKHYLIQFHPDYSDEYDTFETFDEKLDWRVNPECPVLNPWMPVKYEPGARLIMERNPYYYAVDTAGNQLPYIDRVEVTYVESLEVSKLKVIAGEQEFCGRPCKYQPLSELSLFKQNEDKGNYRTFLWDGGSGTGSVYYPNWNHPDPEKQAVYRDKRFRRALSHAIDRPKIQKVVYFGTGFPTTGTLSPKAIEYNRTEEGKKLFEQWRDLAVEYDPEKAKALLDEMGVVDQDGDGYRELPSGKKLELRIDMSAEASREYSLCSEIVKENWEAVGLKTILNPVPGEQLGVLETSAEFDIRNSWEVGDGPNHLVYPQWFVPIGNQRWAPLYGAWYSVKGTDKEGTELDKDPRDRTPPRDEPPADGPVARLQALYDKAKIEPDDEKREQLVFEMMKIHIEEGPFFIGTVANIPTIVVAKKNVGNVPTREQLGLGGFTNPWIMVYFGAVYPEQFFFKDI
ncbi:MAG: ABC transporter substrate-binding protein [Chloroflexi bacterium]|nr:ABC transporter substrate-binding protein [Chloroflexota bacterium]